VGTTLLDLVAASIKLTQRGRAHWAPCPFHGEKTSSFKVEERHGKERYHCFGCGARGDAADWIMHTRHVSYVEAKRILGEERAKPDPTLIAARQAATRRQQAIEAYRDRNPDCACPDWLLAT
jgi:DNA primase